MPAKTTAKAKPQDLETVVQIALDAADAAMDVTSEFARISTEFQKAKNTFGRLEKTVKITALAVGGLLFVGVLLVGLLLARTADKMNILTATNTELLTVFTENISMMNDGVGSLQGPFWPACPTHKIWHAGQHGPCRLPCLFTLSRLFHLCTSQV